MRSMQDQIVSTQKMYTGQNVLRRVFVQEFDCDIESHCYCVINDIKTLILTGLVLASLGLVTIIGLVIYLVCKKLLCNKS